MKTQNKENCFRWSFFFLLMNHVRSGKNMWRNYVEDYSPAVHTHLERGLEIKLKKNFNFNFDFTYWYSSFRSILTRIWCIDMHFNVSHQFFIISHFQFWFSISILPFSYVYLNLKYKKLFYISSILFLIQNTYWFHHFFF